jgi:hypothetical protein
MRRELFAIKHKPTGGFLPEHSGRGYTWTEPSLWLVPRLFLDAGAAKRALTWWLKGTTTVARNRDYFGEYDEVWTTEVEQHRKAEDMEVVKVLLQT